MPDMTTPKVLRGFNLFVDGQGYAGMTEEVELPKLALKTEEFRPGGYDAPIEMDLGMEKIECSFTLADFNPDVLALFGLGHNAPVACTIRGALGHGDTEVTPVVVNLQGMWREVEPPKLKAGEKMELKATVSCKYYRLEVGGRVVHEIDIENMTRIIDGVDQMAATRAAIGR